MDAGSANTGLLGSEGETGRPGVLPDGKHRPSDSDVRRKIKPPSQPPDPSANSRKYKQKRGLRRTLQRCHKPGSGGDTTQGLPQTHGKEKREEEDATDGQKHQRVLRFTDKGSKTVVGRGWRREEWGVRVPWGRDLAGEKDKLQETEGGEGFT